MKKMHSRLMAENGAYSDWHSDPVHKPLHWLAFFAVVALVTIGINNNLLSPLLDNIASRNVASVTQANKKIPGQWIIEFNDDAKNPLPPGLAKKLVQDNAGELKYEYTKAIKGFSAKLSDSAINGLRNNPHIKLIEQDATVSVATTEINATWGIDRIDQTNLPLNETYNYTASGKGVNAYVVDTGIRSTHEEFRGRMGNGVTFINDAYGIDGCHWHGTHVAGTLGGTKVGVAKGVILHSVRVLDCNGSGTWSAVIAGIDWVSQNKISPAVMNISIEGPSLIQSVNDAVKNAVNSGITVVSVAGNGAKDACTYAIASEPTVITVGATGMNDGESAYSNYGPCVDIFAPGDTVYSAMSDSDTSYASQFGTSMAAPHVAGVAALYLETHPTALPAEVNNAIISSATKNVITGLGAGSPNLLLNSNLGGVPYPTPYATPYATPYPTPYATPYPTPTSAPTLSLSAAPASVITGQSSTLTWSSTNTTSCTASGGWTGTKTTSGSQTVTPTVTTTYTLKCLNATSSVTQSAKVTVSLPPWNIGRTVTATTKTNVRATPSASGKVLGQQTKGKTGKITAASVSADGYVWWNIDFASGADGWVASIYLK